MDAGLQTYLVRLVTFQSFMQDGRNRCVVGQPEEMSLHGSECNKSWSVISGCRIFARGFPWDDKARISCAWINSKEV